MGCGGKIESIRIIQSDANFGIFQNAAKSNVQLKRMQHLLHYMGKDFSNGF